MQRPRSWLLLLLCCSFPSVWAEEPAELPQTPEQELQQAVRRAQELVAEDDQGALIALALGTEPDPWLIADELIALGERRTALQFAQAAREAKGDGQGILPWLEARRDRHESAARRQAWRLAAELGVQGKAEEALAQLDLAHGGFHDILGARCSYERGRQLRELKQADRSIRSFARAALIAKELGWIHQRSQALQDAAMTAFRRAEHGRAAELWQERLEVERERGITPELIGTYENLGLARANLGEYAAALTCHTQALEICRTLSDSAGISRSLVNIGVLHDRRGDAIGAQRAYEEAIVLLEASIQKAKPQQAIGSKTMACEQWGDFTDAIARCQHSMEVTQEREARFASGKGSATGTEGESVGAELDPDAALLEQGVCFSLGKLYRRLGRVAQARAQYHAALKIAEALPDPFSNAQALGAIAQLDADAGDHAAAIDGYSRSIGIQQEIGDPVGEAWTHVYLGDVHLAASDAPAAVAEYQRGLEMLSELEFRTSIVIVLARLSRAYLLAGQRDEAMASARRALDESVAIGDEGSALLARQTLARIHLERGEPARALEYVRDAARDLRTVAHGLSVADGISTREYFSRLFELAAQAALALDDPAEVLFVLEMGRAGTLLEALGSRGTVRASVVPPKLQEAEEAARAQEAVAQRRLQAARAGGDRKEVRARRDELEAARRALESTISRIQLLSRSAADMVYSEPIDLKRLRMALLPREALVLYGVFEEQSVALVVEARTARIVRLGPSTAIRNAVNEADFTSSSSDAEATAAQLIRLLVTPLALEPGIERVFISPHGVLHIAPFSALLPDMELVWLPSATTWLVLRDQHFAQGAEVLALGDPQYASLAAGDTQGERSGSTLAPLPATRDEVLAVGNVLLLGDEASEERLRESLLIPTRWRAVHLACHGLLDADRPWQSSLALSPDRQNDGFLTVLDLLRLRVASDLAVLSACETGRGAIYSAEGILGLSRAFMHAGAPRVLASLWKVDDDATRALMEKFYEQWNPPDGKGVGAAVALLRAQAYVRAQPEWSHPYFWAAWVLWGLPE